MGMTVLCGELESGDAPFYFTARRSLRYNATAAIRCYDSPP
jgi:hypothetical protein